MTTISIDDASQITTVIGTFTAEPGCRQELVTLLSAHAATLLRHQDGFIACSIHSSGDGTHVLKLRPVARRESRARHARRP